MFTLYKVFYEEGLVYVGRTVQPLMKRLNDHYCRKHRLKELERDKIVRLEFAQVATQADMNIYEVFLINQLKPSLNKDDKAADYPSLTLPELDWQAIDFT